MLNAVLVIELVALALAAGVVGLVCGYLIAAALLPDVAASLRGLYGAQIPGELTLKPEWWIAGLGISVAGALAAAAASLFKAISPSGAGDGAALCLAAGAASLADASGRCWRSPCLPRQVAVLLVRRFADRRDLPCWRPCCSARRLALPALLECVLRSGSAARAAPLAVWFWADSRQQLSGLSLALMALLLALAVNVGVGTMVESFSRTFVGWLDGRLAADVYVNASDDAQAPRSRAWLRARPEVAGDPAGRPRRHRRSAARRSRFSGCPITPPIATIGRCCNRPRMPGIRLRPAMPASSASSWPGG